jgi:hypothetical protein
VIPRLAVQTACRGSEVDGGARSGRFACFGSAFPVVSDGDRGSTIDLGMENAVVLESLSGKFQFQFVELGRRVAQFVSQQPTKML